MLQTTWQEIEVRHGKLSAWAMKNCEQHRHNEIYL